MSVLHNEYDLNCFHAPTYAHSQAAVNGTTCNDAVASHEWNVDIFRYTDLHGWQQQVPLTDGDGVRMAVHRQHRLTVSPRKNCIVIPALRQKFTLRRDDAPKDRTTMVQRGDSILLVSNPHMQPQQKRAMVLRFDSKRACQDFSAAFLRHNPPKRSSALSASSPTATASGEPSFTAGTRSGDGQRHKDAVLSYVARLLHDPGFVQFASKLESHIAGSVDGVKMLEGLTASGDDANRDPAVPATDPSTRPAPLTDTQTR